MGQAPLKAHTFTMDTHCLPSLKIGDEEKDIQEEVPFFFFQSELLKDFLQLSSFLILKLWNVELTLSSFLKFILSKFPFRGEAQV